MNNPELGSVLWQNALKQIQTRVSSKDFETWILELGVRFYDGETLTLEAPFGLFRDRVKQSFIGVIEEQVVAAKGGACAVLIEVGQTATRARPPSRHAAVSTPVSRSLGVLTKTFADFIVGESNRLAYMSAQQVVAGAGAEGNPLFISGDVGLGKTHLLRAIQHALTEQRRAIQYFQGEDFVRTMVGALQKGTLSSFHAGFRRAEALLLDDVQFLGNKKRTQEELHNAFEVLHGRGKPVVIVADRRPEELEGFTDRLLDRFSGGLLVEIAPLDQTLRRKILRQKLAERGVALEEYLLERASLALGGSVREIEGLVARCHAAGSQELPVDEGALETFLEPFRPRAGKAVNLDDVISLVAFAHGLTTDELRARDRSRRVAWPRHVAEYLCRKLTDASLPEIGRAMGGRNHTSVLRAVRSVVERASQDAEFALKLQQLEKLAGAPPAKLVA